jgi:hypothetical protein
VAPDWVGDVVFCELMGWTYDELMDAPSWWVERAKLFFGVRAEWRNQKSKQSE